MAHGILLDAGSNEMELLIFRVGPSRFGVNVSKIREIVQRVDSIPVPHAPPSVEGCFKIREEILTLINLGRWFGMESDDVDQGGGMIIILELNFTRCGMLVDGVEGIERMSWSDIDPPSEYLTQYQVPLTGVARVGDNIVMIADFESIVQETLGLGAATSESAQSDSDSGSAGTKVSILLAEDSSTITGITLKTLRNAGYERIKCCQDGQSAWEALQKAAAGGEEERFDVVVTDVEMPRMDGFHLTAKIKKDDALKDTPVIIFSSLISEENINKGEQVGADAQVCKRDGADLPETIERCLLATANA